VLSMDLVCIVHFVRFVCLLILLDFNLWRLHANLPYTAPSGLSGPFGPFRPFRFYSRRGSMPLFGRGD
jgi:hypothetical protein